MNDKLQKLYNLYKQQGLITDATSFEKFSNATPEQQSALYNLGLDNGLFLETGEDKFKAVFEESKPKEPGFFEGLFGSDKESANTVSNTMMGKVGAYEPDVKKKAASTASSSGKSLSVSPSKPKTPFEIAEEDKRAKQAMMSKQDFKSYVDDIQPSLVTKDEELVVPKLQNMFSDYGFNFEQAGAGYDAVKVTAPNGKTLQVSIDRFTDKGDLESSNELKAFIDANKPKIDNEVSQYGKYYKRYKNQKEVDEAYKTIGQETATLQAEKNRLATDIVKSKAEEEELKKNPNAEKLQLLAQKKQEIASRTAALAEMQKLNENNHARLEEAVGKYTRNVAAEAADASNKGSWYGIAANTLLEGGYGIGAGLMDVGAYIQSKANALVNATDLALRGDIPLSDAWKISNAMGNVQKEEVTKGIEKGKELLKENVEFEVGDAYKKAAQENFFARNALGVINFLPAIGASMVNPMAGYTAFFASGYDGAMEEMKNNPAFKDIGTDEKVGVATALGFANAAIMKYSPTNKFLESPAGKKIVGNILTKMGSETSAKSLQEFAENEVKSAVGRGLVSTAGTLPHGFATGVELKLSGDLVKEVYNTAKKDDMFQFPETAGEYVKQVAESGLDMAVGGAMMGGIRSISTGYKENNFNNVNDAVIDNYKIFSNPDMLTAYEESLNIKVANGDMTEAQKNAELNDARMGIAVLNKMPDNFTAAQKRKAFSLIREREMLEQRIEGKDKSLVKGETERITEINKELEDVSKQAPAEAPAPATATAKPSYSINGKEMSEADFSKAISEMPVDEVKKADIKATNASESVTNLLKDVATRSGVESAPMMETTAPAPAVPTTTTPTTLEQELREKFDYDFYEELLNSEYEWERERAKEFLADPKAYFENRIEIAKENLKYDPNDVISKDALDDNTEKLKIFNEITNKYKENAIQKPTTEEGVLRTEQPEVELPTMGEGNAQETTTQEGVAPAKPEEVKPIRNLDESSEQNKGTEISNLKKDINKGLGKDMEIAPEEVKELDKLEFTVFPKDDIDKSDTDKPIILIRKRGTPELSVSEALEDAQEGKGSLSDYFEIVDGRHRIKKALSNGEKLKAVVVTEAEYEKATGTKLYSEKTKNILGDLGVKTIEQGIAELENVKSKTEYKKQFGRDLAEDLSILEEEQQQRYLLDKPEAKPIEQELAELEQMFPETKTGENKGVAASDFDAMLEMHSRVTDERAKNVIRTAYRLTKTLKSLFPNAEINIHETEESYNGAMEENNSEKGSSGNIKLGVDADGKPTVRIDINVSKASALDVAHEVAHAVLQKAFGSNEKLFKSFQERIAKVISTDKNQRLLDFANNPKYKEQGVTYEEYMAELKAILSQEGAKIELSTAKKIAAIINEFVSKITNGKFKPFQEVTDVKQVVDFVNKVTEAMAKGEAIDVEGAGKIGEGSRSSLRVGNNVEETAENLKEVVSPQGEGKEYTYYLTDNGLQIGDKDYKYNLMSEIFNKVGARKYALLIRKYIDPTFNKETLGYSNRPFAEHLKYELHSLSRDYNIDQIKDLAKAADIKIDLPAPSKDNIRVSDYYRKNIAEAYHEGNNPSVTQAVDALLGNVISRSSLRTAEQVDKMVKDARASGYSERAIEEFLKKRGVDQSIIDKSLGKKEAGKKIVTNEEMMPGYDKMMEDVNSEILRGLDRKTNETTIEKNVMKIVEGSEAYKNATDQQKNEITREVKKAFGEKMKEAPSAEKITGKEDKTATENANKLKDQIKLEAKAAKEGASSVKTAIKKIRDFVVNNKETANLTRKDLLKVIDIMKSVKDEKSLEKATNKVLDIIDKANKDIIEVSKTKMDAAKMKAELKAAKDSAKGVVNKIKAVKAYFDSVQEYGNLTRKDLRRIMKEIASVKDEASLDKAVNNINDIIDKATSDKIEISEKKMIANTIKEVKLAKGNIKEKRKMIADVIDEIKKSGKLSASQVNALLKRANRLNVENFEHLNKFIEYTEKLFADADYDNKLSKGDGLRESIAKLSKNKGNKYNASLVALAEKFLSIKPSMVDDIDQYNKIASDLKDAVKGSSAKGFKSTVDIKAVDAYVDEMMTSQKEKLTEAMREQVNKLLGVDGSTLTYEEMQKMLEKKKEDMSDEEEKIIRSAAIKLFDTLSSTINHILETGKDPFTGEAVDIKQSKKDVVKRFMEMDLTKMDIKDAIAAVDSLNNFIVNESTAKMEKVLSKYNTKRNMEMLIKNKITSSVLKIFRSGWLGRGLLKQLGSETILMDALFKGTGRASIVAKAMGLSDYKSNVSKAKAVVRNMVADYVVEFYKKEANGEAFNTAFNNTERGMLAFMSRVKIGKEDASFKDRKSLVEQSIKALRNGDEREVEKANLYQEVYDKILKDSESLDDVKSKVDETNAKAVDFWIEKWAENYEELADVSENIHNVILGKFGNYTPDVVKRVKEYSDKKVSEEDVLDSEYSAFLNNSGIVQKKSGRLEKTTVEDTLPENSYYDFGFDNNNSSLMSDALIDAKTAGNVIELSTFLNSPEFNKIVITSKERNVLKSAISGYVRAVRGKEKYNYDEVSDLVKSFNRASALGASYVLGGVGAIPKQYLVPAVNTMIASGGNLPHFDIWWNKAKQDFVNNSGESVAIRGVMSNADIKNIDNLLQEAAKSKPEIALRKIEQVNKIYLKHFLVNRDVAIAKASWLTYYEKGLRKQGKFTTVEKIPTESGFVEVTKKGIDYSKHELNKEAAQYATRMVDRQQNISDEDFRGRFYSNKEGLGPIVTKVLLPFASFRINQWLRMNTDLGILTNKTTTYEDRLEAAKSLAATGTEIAFFNFIGMGISAGLHSLAISAKRAITGAGDDEEDKKKQKEMDEKYWNNLKKSKRTALVQDFFSPTPITDPIVEIIAYNLLDKLQADKKEKDRINIYDPKPTEVQTWLDYAAAHSGGAGILLDRVSKFKEIASAYLDGKIETTAYGETTEKNIREKHKGTLGALTTLAFLNTLGVFPAEVYNAQNTAFKEIKKEASTKTEAEIIQAKAKKREQRADNIEKIQVINRAINVATDQDVVNELMKMKRETRMELFPDKISDEAKEVLKRKREREKASYKRLLGGYDTKTDLKRYDPDLYEQNFGENSEYGQTHKAEVKADKLFDAMMKKTKDEKYGYTPPPKKKSKKRKKNSDGSYKSSYFRYSSN